MATSGKSRITFIDRQENPPRVLRDVLSAPPPPPRSLVRALYTHKPYTMIVKPKIRPSVLVYIVQLPCIPDDALDRAKAPSGSLIKLLAARRPGVSVRRVPVDRVALVGRVPMAPDS